MLTLFILAIVGVHSAIGIQVKTVSGPYNNLTGSSFWLAETQSFYWSDYWTFDDQPCIFRYDVVKRKVYSAYIEGKTLTAYLAPVARCGLHFSFNNDLFLSGSLHENYLIRWNGIDQKAKVIDTEFRVEANIPDSHMDFGAPNKQGKFIVGTTNDVYCLGDANRALYSYTKADGVQVLYTGFKSTTGLAFDGNKIYHNDVCRQKIESLERDASGNYFTKIVYDFANSTARILPSGLEIDDRGFLYTTGYGTGNVWRIDPKTGTIEVIATLPSKYLTSVVFGGPFRDTLYVVASSVLFNAYLDVVDFAPAPPLYEITGLGARGVRSSKMVC